MGAPRLAVVSPPSEQGRSRKQQWYPGEIESEFRRSLGRHNLHLNLLELAARNFSAAIDGQPSEREFVRRFAKSEGFHSLHPEDASFKNARIYLVFSHIAYVFSAGDALCQKVRSHRQIRALKTDDQALTNALDDGDFVTKTLALAILASMSKENRSVLAVRTKVEQVRETPAFAAVNYYRLARNAELHALGKEGEETLRPEWLKLPHDAISALYGQLQPNRFNEMSAQDALLCSKAWQDVARWLCRHMLNLVDVSMPMLRRRFGNLKPTRREGAARLFMKDALLLTEDEIVVTLEELGWAAV